jgi:hypothetical protein
MLNNSFEFSLFIVIIFEIYILIGISVIPAVDMFRSLVGGVANLAGDLVEGGINVATEVSFSLYTLRSCMT